MKRKHIIAVLAVTLIAGGFVGVQAAEKTNTTKTQTTCPVMGGKINKAQFVDAKGFRIYVCCPGCIAKVKADPDKYIKELESKGIELEKAATQTETTQQKSGSGGCCGN